jgi:putative colanic acid biosynthesis acetyltransferase WcaF
MKNQEVDLAAFQNEDFDPGAGILKRLAWFLINSLFFKTGWHFGSGVKSRLLRLFGARVGKGVVIKPSVNVKYPWNLELGNNCWIGEKVWIDNLVKVRIGNNVCISQGAMLLCGNHNYKKSSFDLITGEIILENGCWIGAKSIVGPGVTVFSHAILTLGSVCTSDLKAYTIYRGNPAVPVRVRVMEEAAI